MRNSTLCLVIVTLLFTGSGIGQTDNDDTQFWNETTVEFPLDRDNKKMSGIVIGNLRVTDNISDLSDKRIGFAVKYKLNKYITLQPSYIFRVQTSSGPTRYEHRARFDFTPKKTFENFSLENRSRFEHRFKTADRKDETYYRNRTKVGIPVKRDGETIFTLFLSNDTYFDLRNTRVHRNDSVGGISKEFSENFTTDFFYQYRHNFQSSQKHLHIFGVNFKIKVK